MIPEIETQSAVKIKMFQELKLKEMLSYISEHSTYYKNLFKSENIKPSLIQSLEDLAHLPVTTKEDLQQHNNQFICVPNHKIVDYVTTSGT